MARAVLDDLATAFFPGDCRVCDGPLTRAGLAPVCDGCVARIAPQTGSGQRLTLCGRCGEALEIDLESDRFAGHGAQVPGEGLLCAPCRLAPPPFERAVAYGVYDKAMRELVHLLKYERMRSLAKPLGAMLAAAIGSLELTGAVTVVVVPLYPAKERQRGYNQAVLLAEAARLLLREAPGLRLTAAHGALRRVRDTESQYALNPRMRRANLRGAFEVVDPAALLGRTVLLVDDIYTTGATARECARVLQRGGAAKVYVATLARAQAKAVEYWDAG